MPIYCFECPCGHRREVLRQIKDRNDSVVCPQCRGQMTRNTQTEMTNTPLQAFHKPIEMFSIAPTSANEERELRKAVPDAEWDERLKVPKAKDRHQKLRLLRACNYVETN